MRLIQLSKSFTTEAICKTKKNTYALFSICITVLWSISYWSINNHRQPKVCPMGNVYSLCRFYHHKNIHKTSTKCFEIKAWCLMDFEEFMHVS